MHLTGTSVALVTFLLPVITYFVLLTNLDKHIFHDENQRISPLESVFFCLLIFCIVGLVSGLTTCAVYCLVVDARLKNLTKNCIFAIFFTICFHCIVLHLRNEHLFEYFFPSIHLPPETYLYALYICLSRVRYFLQTLLIVNSDHLLQGWHDELREMTLGPEKLVTAHTLLNFLPTVEFFVEATFFPGLKHSTVVWLGSSDQSTVLKQVIAWFFVDNVPVNGGFTLLGVPLYTTFAIFHFLLSLALIYKTESNWFIVLTVLEGGLVFSAQILLLNPISFFVTFFIWFYIKPYRQMKDAASVSLENLMFSGGGSDFENSSNDSKKCILSSSSSASSTLTSTSKDSFSDVSETFLVEEVFRY